MIGNRLFSKLVLGAFVLAAASPSQAECRYKPNKEGFGFSFTAYAAPNKTYVIKDNRFKKFTLASPSGMLQDASIEIDATSLDTGHDLNNGKGGEWPAAIIPVRDSNVVNHFFKKFDNNPGVVSAKVAGITKDGIDLAVTMNGVTKTVPMKSAVKDGVLSATGTLNVLDFGTGKAFDAFRQVCEMAFHQGKTWSDIEFEFHVPVEGSCS
ncbi:MAG: YceI family protein [Pseudomonadota bacterium]|jgi:hypothetical protein